MNENGRVDVETPNPTEVGGPRPAGARHYKGGGSSRDRKAPVSREPAKTAEPDSKKGLRKRLGPGKRRWRRLGPKEILLLIIPVIALAAAAAAMYFMTRDASSYTIQGQAYQYYAGSAYPLTEGARLCRSEDGDTLMVSDNRQDVLSSLPIYFKDKQVIALPYDMAYYDPRKGDALCVPYFSEISYRSSGTAVVQREKEEAPLSGGFLYDGGDIYLFLEPVTLTFNGYSLELPFLSYVEAQGNGSVTVYNFESGDFLIEAPTGEATATGGGGDYTVSLLGDSMQDYQGERTLLSSRPDILDPAF